MLIIEEDGFEDVFDFTVPETSNFFINDVLVHNCGEITLDISGAFCVIADTVPYFAASIEEACDIFRIATRALIRVNTMDSIYNKEVKRTNRIGVGMTGVHEFAWKFFGYGFKDLIDEDKSKDFWMTLALFNRIVREESISYSKKLGMNTPHTCTTLKPAGCGVLSTPIKTTAGMLSFSNIFEKNGIDVENINPGEWFDLNEKISVLDKNNEEKEVQKLYCNGVEEVFAITFEDGNTYEFTGNHQFLTSEGWVRMDNLTGNEDIISF